MLLQDLNADEPRRQHWKLLFKLAFFCIIMLINQKFLFQIFLYPARLWYTYYGQQASYDVFYFVSWFVSDISSYLVPALAAFFMFRGDRRALPKQEGYKAAMEMPLIFFATCFLGSLASMLAQWISALLDSLFGTGEIPDAMSGSLPSEGQSGSAWIFLLFVVVIAPVCEELIFRKLLLQSLRSGGDIFAAVASALIFGAYHGNFDQFPYAFVVGLLYGILAVRSSSMVPTMVLHILNNLLVSAGSYLTDMLGEDTAWAVQVQSWAASVMGLAFWVGIPATVLLVVAKAFKTSDRERISAGELFGNPAVYVGLLAVVLMLF